MSTQQKIAAYKARINRLREEGDKDLKETQEAVQAALKAQEGDTSEARYKNLKVTWEGPEGRVCVRHSNDGDASLTHSEFLRAVSNLPNVVGAKVGAKLSKHIGKSRLEIMREYKERAQKRATDVYHLEEKIAELQA